MKSIPKLQRCDEITYPFPNFNGCTIEVQTWISNFIPHLIMDVIAYPSFPALNTKTLTWWIGLNDIKREHHFVWDGTNRTFVNGTDAGNFLTAQGIHWEPNDQDNEDCVEIRWEQRHYYEQVHAPFELQWNDNSCSHQARFICEKDAWTTTF